MSEGAASGRAGADDGARDGTEPVVVESGKGLISEDWLAVVLGGLILTASLAAVYLNLPSGYEERVDQLDEVATQLDSLPEGSAEDQRRQLQEELNAGIKQLTSNPIRKWIGTPANWTSDPREALIGGSSGQVWPGIVGAFLISLVVFGAGSALLGKSPSKFAPAFVVVFLLATLAYALASHEVIEYYNLEYALWALVVGLLISNTIGTPRFLQPAIATEFYIKTGLVLLGAEVLFSRLLALGLPGIAVAWIVTPIVLTTTYLFGQYVLRIESRSLNMVISADMSVCGVSAAIATAAACRAKKEELSLAIGISLTFTVIMMVVMPAVIKALGLSPVLGGAWIGGTIDSTGAVAAAGELVGTTAAERQAALTVAATVKMIQNILIGVVAFFVAIFWVVFVERSPNGQRPNAMEIWYRFPKFVLGFVAASILFSLIYSSGLLGQSMVSSVISSTKGMRGWFFCLAFVSIGLETNFRQLSRQLSGGKPLILYVCGQSFNLCLTLLMAWLMFEKIFVDATKALTQ